MNNENYYIKLKENFTAFKSLNLEPDIEKTLKDTISLSYRSLAAHKKEIENARLNNIHSDEYKAGKLAEHKGKLQQGLDRAFNAHETMLATAQGAVRAAVLPPEPEDATERLLLLLQRQEIRQGLEKMPLKDRSKVTLQSVQEGKGDPLQSILTQPMTSDLLPKEELARYSDLYVEKVFPQCAAELKMAERNAEAATLVRNLTAVTFGHIEQNLS